MINTSCEENVDIIDKVPSRCFASVEFEDIVTLRDEGVLMLRREVSVNPK
jgi:hypothetical protein